MKKNIADAFVITLLLVTPIEAWIRLSLSLSLFLSLSLNLFLSLSLSISFSLSLSFSIYLSMCMCVCVYVCVGNQYSHTIRHTAQDRNIGWVIQKLLQTATCNPNPSLGLDMHMTVISSLHLNYMFPATNGH